MSNPGGNGGNGVNAQHGSAFAGAGIQSAHPADSASGELDDETLLFDDEVDADMAPPAKEKPKGKKTNYALIIGSVVVILVVGVGLLLWLLASDGGTRQINARVADASRAMPTTAATDQQLTAAAIEKVRDAAPPSATASPVAGQTVAPVVVQPGGVATAGQTPVVVTPGVATTVGAGADAQTAQGTRELPSSGGGPHSGQTAASTGDGLDAQPNPQRSFVFGDDESRVARQAADSSAAGNSLDNRLRFPAAMVPGSASAERAPAQIARPPFGAMVPLRTVGAIQSLRSGALVRFTSARAVGGQGWQIASRTTFVGTVRSAEFDRISVSIIGFIDPASGRLVKVGGEIYGADGAPSIQGKRRRIDSRWLRVFGQVANAGISLAESALRGNAGATVIIPGAQGEYQTQIEAMQGQNGRREFVEVEAGKPCYVMVTDLPRSVQGVDALEEMSADELSSTLEGSDSAGTGISQSELSSLLSTGSPEQIRSALPRMTPAMRQLAEAYLQNGDK